MDAAARDELTALRARAYGPSPDIAGDAAALARLIELEERALPAASAPVIAEVLEARTPVIAEVPEAATVVSAPMPLDSAPPRRWWRRRWQIIAVAAVAVIVVVLGVSGGLQSPPEASLPVPQPTPAAVELIAPAPAPDPDAKVLIRILIDSDTGDYVDLSSSSAPPFPVSGKMRWTQPLGEYYGWRLWIGGAPSRGSDQHCILLAAESDTMSQCTHSDADRQRGMRVSLPFAQIASDQRPAGMTAEESVTFTWGPDAYVTVLLTGVEADR